MMLAAATLGLMLPTPVPTVDMVQQVQLAQPSFLLEATPSSIFPSTLLAETDCEGNELRKGQKLSPECEVQKKVQRLRAEQLEQERKAAEKLEILKAIEARQEANAQKKALRAAKRAEEEAAAVARAAKAYQTSADRAAAEKLMAKAKEAALPLDTCVYCAPTR
eukprot:CAMPEP_0176366674 /NCGR_PEP_ID=MMETSP0126-20121128/21339_1 /TAXON_ID=141414 ORGANISM="Strombidinopsis acuminatum, Strain SPMC142" /NCGR_SAMPLE_ID=MMETSP0126 /ASSEMBLY_ACC=CAM_ASM_000229 /LENGTH=163 /DNA_ID=CAMNT_0017724177 /DNA_START=102 /DNA_END=596 /DNA_ORIENTATION=+